MRVCFVRNFIFMLVGFTMTLSSSARAAICPENFAKLFKRPTFTAPGDWQPVTEVLEADQGAQLAAVIESNERFVSLAGKAEIVEVLPGYRAFAITDAAGVQHIVDPATARTWRPPENSTSKELASLQVAKRTKPQASIDEAKLKSFICARRATLKAELRENPELKRTFEILDRHVGTMKLPAKTVIRRIMPLCAASVSGAFGGAYYTYLKREAHEDNFVSNHQSNFTEGIMIMGFVHACLTGGYGALDAGVLKMVLGFNIVGNTYAEISLGQDRAQGVFAQPVTGPAKNTPKKVVTDVGDFAAGMSGVVLYFAAVKAIENSYGFKVSKMCD